MTERQLRFKVRMQILENFHQNKSQLVLHEKRNRRTRSDTIMLSEVRKLVRKELLRRLREQKTNDDEEPEEIADDFSAMIDDKLAGVMQQAEQMAQSAGTGKKTNEIGFAAAIILFPAAVELIAKITQVIGWGIRKVINLFSSEERKEPNFVEKIGKALEHWVEESVLKKVYYRAIGYLIKALIEGSAKGVLGAINELEGRNKPEFANDPDLKDSPYLGGTTGPIARAAQSVLEESAKTDYIKIGSWIFKAISLVSIGNAIQGVLSNWHSVLHSVEHAVQLTIEAFEAVKMTSSAGEILIGLLGAAAGSFLVVKVYKKLADLLGGFQKLSDIASGKAKLDLDFEIGKQAATA